MSKKRIAFAAIGGVLCGIALECLKVETWSADWWFLLAFFNVLWSWDRCDA